MQTGGVESLSRQALAALVVGATGPATFLAVFALFGGRVAASVVDPADLVESMVDLLLASLLLALVAAGLAAITTMAAFVLTRARWAVGGWLVSVVLFPVWIQVVDQVPDLGLASYCFALGVLPGVVRLLLPTRARTRSVGVTPVLTDL